MTTEQHNVTVGMTAKFFHPLTMGVMHYGRVTKLGEKLVQVKFDIDGKKHWTFPDFIGKENNHLPTNETGKFDHVESNGTLKVPKKSKNIKC